MSRAARESSVFTKSNRVSRANSSRLRWQNVRKLLRSGVSQRFAMYDSPRPMSPRLRIASIARQSFRMKVAARLHDRR